MKLGDLKKRRKLFEVATYGGFHKAGIPKWKIGLKWMFYPYFMKPPYGYNHTMNFYELKQS